MIDCIWSTLYNTTYSYLKPWKFSLITEVFIEASGMFSEVFNAFWRLWNPWESRLLILGEKDIIKNWFTCKLSYLHRLCRSWFSFLLLHAQTMCFLLINKQCFSFIYTKKCVSFLNLASQYLRRLSIWKFSPNPCKFQTHHLFSNSMIYDDYSGMQIVPRSWLFQIIYFKMSDMKNNNSATGLSPTAIPLTS